MAWIQLLTWSKPENVRTLTSAPRLRSRPIDATAPA